MLLVGIEEVVRMPPRCGGSRMGTPVTAGGGVDGDGPCTVAWWDALRPSHDATGSARSSCRSASRAPLSRQGSLAQGRATRRPRRRCRRRPPRARRGRASSRGRPRTGRAPSTTSPAHGCSRRSPPPRAPSTPTLGWGSTATTARCSGPAPPRRAEAAPCLTRHGSSPGPGRRRGCGPARARGPRRPPRGGDRPHRDRFLARRACRRHRGLDMVGDRRLPGHRGERRVDRRGAGYMGDTVALPDARRLRLGDVHDSAGGRRGTRLGDSLRGRTERLGHLVPRDMRPSERLLRHALRRAARDQLGQPADGTVVGPQHRRALGTELRRVIGRPLRRRRRRRRVELDILDRRPPPRERPGDGRHRPRRHGGRRGHLRLRRRREVCRRLLLGEDRRLHRRATRHRHSGRRRHRRRRREGRRDRRLLGGEGWSGVYDVGAPDLGTLAALVQRRAIGSVAGIAGTPTGSGYWMVTSLGHVFGTAGPFGTLGAEHRAAPVVGMSATPTGKGYWLVASDGGIFTFGAARFYGSAAAAGHRSASVGTLAG